MNTTTISDPRRRISRKTEVFWTEIIPALLGYLHVAGDVPIATDYTHRFSCWLPPRRSHLAPAFPVSNAQIVRTDLKRLQASFPFQFFSLFFSHQPRQRQT